MLEVFSAVGRFVLDDQASGALDKIDEKAGKTSKSLGQKLGGGLQTAGKYALGLGVAVGAAGAGLFAMATKGAEATDRIDKMSQRLGMSRQAFQEWDFIMSQNGVSIDSMQNGMKTLSTRMAEAGEGAGKGATLFEQLGVSVTNSSGEFRNQEEVFKDSIIALQGMDDGIEKAALAQQLFGKSGQELLPMLNGSKGSIEELTAKAHELGLVLGDDAVDAGVLFTDTMDQLKRMGQAVFNQVATALMPVFQEMAEWVIENMPEIQEFFGTAFAFIGEVIEAMKPLMNNFLIPLLKATFEWIGKALRALQQFWDKWGTDITRIAKTTFEFVSQIIKGALDVIKGIFNIFVGLFTGDWQRMNRGLEQLWRGFWNIITNIVRGAWGMLSGAFAGVRNSIFNWFNGLASSAYNWGRNMISGFVDGIRSMIGQVTDAASSVVNAAKNFLGFRSPTKEGEGRYIEDWGSGMVEGFMDGMENAMPGLHNMMRGIVPNLEPSFNMSGSAAVGGGITIQNMSVRNDNDIKQIARELYQLQQRASRGGGKA